jgi:thiol-disulfide isomerase/thioredoxin
MQRLLTLLLLVFFSAAAHAQEAGKDMPTNNLYQLITRHDGWLNTERPLKPEDLQGRIILLDFWTYCCINCMHVIPDLQYLEQTFGSNLTVIGVHSAKFKNERDSENIRQAILRYGIHHPVVNDFDFSTWKSFGIRAWPTFVLINPQGIIEDTYSGEGNRAHVEKEVAALLKKYAGKVNTSPLPLALEKDKQPPTVLSFPSKMAYAEKLGLIFVADSGHHRIIGMKPDGEIAYVIGSGTPGLKDGGFAEAQFHSPQGLVYSGGLDKARNMGMLYVADTENHALRAIDLASDSVSTIAGTGQQGSERDAKNKPGLQTKLASPWALTLFPDDRHLAIAMAGTHQLWSYDIDARTVTAIAGNGRESIDDGSYPNNSLSQPSGVSEAGGKLYFVDSETSSLRVYDHGDVKTLIGSGLFDFGYKSGAKGIALMQHPLGVFATDDGIYVADSYNHSIRRYDPKTGILSDFAGHGVRGSKDGAAAQAEFNEPNDILEIDDKLYVADTNNNAIRIIDLKADTVSTLAVSQPEGAAEYASSLPNSEAVELPVIAADTEVMVSLKLKDGWHINEQAPSYLAVFDADRKPAAAFDHALKSRYVTLPKLRAGSYRVQATLYYCEDRAGAQCLIKSFDAPLTVKAGGKKEVTLPLN